LLPILLGHGCRKARPAWEAKRIREDEMIPEKELHPSAGKQGQKPW
jgi:hypothetical protein